MAELLIASRTAPYKGLASYTEADTELFFGRERECEVIISNLRARRLTLLYGESGVGKSSLLRAGVAARLLREAEEDVEDAGMPDSVPVYFSNWRDNPASAVSQAINAVARRFGASGEPEPAIAAAIASAGTYPLVILDQFEEYFLYHPRPRDDDPFACQFVDALNTPGLQASFLISIREDALAKLDRFKSEVPWLFDASLRVDRLDHVAARDAIVRPLERYNEAVGADERVEIEHELVDAVVRQVTTGRVTLEQGGHGMLASGETDRVETPYLQLVMTRLWDAERASRSGCLRLGTLEQLGGAQRIVRTHLDGALSGLSPHERDVAVDVFHHLVTPSGSKIAHAASDLAEYTYHPTAEIEALLERLAGSSTRIIRPVPPPPGEERPPRFEIYHDVLAPAILDWRTRQRTARRIAEEKRASRAAMRKTLWRIGIAAGFVVLLLILFALRRQQTAADNRAAAERAVARMRLEAATFNNDVRTRYSYTRIDPNYFFRQLRVSGPPGSTVGVACPARACEPFRGTIPRRGALPIRTLEHTPLEIGTRIRILVTHEGYGKRFEYTLASSGINSNTQLCRPRGSPVPASILGVPCA